MIVNTEKPNGFDDENSSNDKATALFNYNGTASATLPFSETFTSNKFPPKGWSVINPDKYFTWTPTTGSQLSGYAPSAMMDNIEYPEKGEEDDLVMPAFNFTHAHKPALIFDHAFALYKFGRKKSDTLKVNVSIDCGNTWQTVYYKGGLDLSTATNGTHSYFSPDSLSQWKRDTIDLKPFAGIANVFIDFKNINGMDNLLYLDNIGVKELHNQKALKESIVENELIYEEHNIIVLPNPVANSFSITGLKNTTTFTLKCFDVTGKRVWQTNKIYNASKSFILPAYVVNGIYFLQIQAADKMYVKKIIVSR